MGSPGERPEQKVQGSARPGKQSQQGCQGPAEQVRGAGGPPDGPLAELGAGLSLSRRDLPPMAAAVPGFLVCTVIFRNDFHLTLKTKPSFNY